MKSVKSVIVDKMHKMQNVFCELNAHGVTVKLCVPGKYYRGTRFDWAGIIRRLSFSGHEYVDEWFDNYDPTHHDCVCGPVEEFTQIGYESALVASTPIPASASEALFLKIGVGMLLRPSAESHYDRFNVYEIADPGLRSFDISSDGSSATFRHQLSRNIHSDSSDPYCGLRSDPPCRPLTDLPTSAPSIPTHFASDSFGYDYVKTISIIGPGEIILSHCLKNTGTLQLSGSVYDHNFFNLDSMQVGPDTFIDFPFKPIGDWRSPYDNVALTQSGIRFSRPLAKGESVFMGNLRPAPQANPASPDNSVPQANSTPTTTNTSAVLSTGSKTSFPTNGSKSALLSKPTYDNSFRLRNAGSGAGVIAECAAPFDYMVFWSNHRVACLEPYIPFHILPGETFSWDIKYRLI